MNTDQPHTRSCPEEISDGMVRYFSSELRKQAHMLKNGTAQVCDRDIAASFYERCANALDLLLDYASSAPSETEPRRLLQMFVDYWHLQGDRFDEKYPQYKDSTSDDLIDLAQRMLEHE